MEKSLISVVMPAYNCLNTLRQSVESVMGQSDPNWELLLLDDCSQDGTGELIRELASLDSRIRAVTNDKNRGVGYTRNRGVSLARGEWIAFLDSDDLWTSDKLEKQRSLAEGHPEADLFFTGSGFMDRDGRRLNYVLHVPEKIDRRRLLKQNLISCSSVLLRRDAALSQPFPQQRRIHEDFAVWLRLLEGGKLAWAVDEPLLIYRLSPQSKSGNKLAAARMNWNTYRTVGLTIPASMYYMGWYTVKGLLKYSKL